MSLPTAMTTADLPAHFYADPETLRTARAARRAGLTLSRGACHCSPQREDCPTCLAAVVRTLAPA